MLKSNNDLFCEKTLYVDSKDEIIHVKIFRPVRVADHKRYECHIIVSSKKDTIAVDTKILGYDSVQSVINAFMYLGAKMQFYNRQYYGGELTQFKGEVEPFPETFGFIKNFPE